MRKTDIRNDLLIAVSLLSRLPFPDPNWNEDKPAASAAWAYPIVGIIVAAVALCVATVLQALGLPDPLVGAAVLLSLVMLTGAMHEDGLADCADGFWGGWDIQRRLDIMKDSRIGTYGVIALVIGLLARWAAITALLDGGALWLALIAAAVLSRAAMVYVMAALPNARGDGLSASSGRPTQNTMLTAICISAVISVLLLDAGGVLAVGVAALCALAMTQLARAKIGGQTGDVLGATQQVSEIAILASLLAI